MTLTRERIRLEDRAVKMSVKTVGKEKVSVLDIPGFYVGLTDDVKVQLQKLEKQNVSSIVIDLLLQQRRRGADRGGIALGSVYSVRPGSARFVITMARSAKTATTMAWSITRAAGGAG
ncbi:hypothetical protein LNO36_18745 [Klebsiella variicola subsp. variicola]|nr:hypothetical protein [Klebsiella variicola subsp. variicola]